MPPKTRGHFDPSFSFVLRIGSRRRTAEGVEIAELFGGTSTYSFDYVVCAVRKGFEDYEVYMSKEEHEAEALPLQEAMRGMEARREDPKRDQ